MYVENFVKNSYGFQCIEEIIDGYLSRIFFQRGKQITLESKSEVEVTAALEAKTREKAVEVQENASEEVTTVEPR